MPKLSNATPKYRKHKACGGQVQLPACVKNL